MTIQANFSSYIGEDASLPVTVYSDAAETIPANITGWSVRFTAALPGGSPVIIQTTANGGITLTTPLSGLLTVSIPATLTVGLPPGAYNFWIERTDSGADAQLTVGTWFLQQKYPTGATFVPPAGEGGFTGNLGD
jgi:hypothetical protein